MNNHSVFKLILLATVVVVASVCYYNYRNCDNVIETIHPEVWPTKIKPQNIGGLVIENSHNTIYDNLRTNNAKSLKQVVMRPDPEKPIDIFASNLISHNDPFENLSDDSTKIGASNSKNSDLTIVSPTDKYTNIDKDKVARQKTNNTLYRLQLASFKSEKESLKELARIKQQFVKTFDISNVRISRESYNNKFFYTIVSGGYTISQAKALCRKLNNMQQTCILY